MNSIRRLLQTAFLIVTASATVVAQQPGAMATLGAIRVPECIPAPDAEYGLTPNKPIEIGGGPSSAQARMSRYFGALRGPQGQALQFTRKSFLTPVVANTEEPVIFEVYQVTFDRESVALYVDTYNFSLPKVPKGFTCGGPLVTALGIPPVDPAKAGSSIVTLAIEQGSARDIAPVPLDVTRQRGYLFDAFTMIAVRARAQAAAGAPLDPKKPPANLDAGGATILAYPVTCGDRTITPQSIEAVGAQAALPRDGEFIRGDALSGMFPGMRIPAASMAARFRQAQIVQIKITYNETCDGAGRDVLLQLRLEPPRLVAGGPASLPPGVVEAEPIVYLQVILDTEGKLARPLQVGGPKSLLPAALDAIQQWRAEPLRLNGVGSITPIVLQVVFR